MTRTVATAGTLLTLVLVVVACGDSLSDDETTRDDAGQVVGEGEVGALALRVGDCIDSSATGEVSAVPVVPCVEAHDAEVFALFDLPDGDFPGEAETTDLAGDICPGDRFTAYVGVEYALSRYEVSFLQPTEETWDALDDREVVCLAVSVTGEPLVGSVKGRAD